MTRSALVLVGHGSHLDPRSARPLYDHADEIRSRGSFAAVHEAFWKEEPSPREVLRTVESDEVYVVPLFTSEGYFTEQVIPRELRLADGWNLDVEKSVTYTDPVGTHDAMTEVIVQRAERVTGDPDVGPGVGLAVVGHGTERNENSARATRTHVDRIRERGRFDEVRALFMDEEPVIDDLPAHFESDELVVVPLFVADGYHTQEDIPEDVGLTDDASAGYDVPAEVAGRTVWYAGAVGTEPLVADVVLERTADAGADFENETRASARGEASIRRLQVDELTEAATEGVDFDGLRAAFDRDGSDDRGFTLETPETRHAGLSEREFRSFARDHPRYVSNWHYWNRIVGGRGTHRRAFLRWLERADRPVMERYDALAGTEKEDETGVTRTWGQLALTVSLSDGGERRYEVRHVDDREADDADLTTYDDPAAIRDLSRFTDDGEYRPLKTAPTLPSGWSFAARDGDDLYRTVEHVYPATVANWHREREGDLDVTHFEEAAARQTGIYAEVEELDRNALERAAEACCVDSQCLKRRAWDASEGDELDAPRGDGKFPCREPCSLFVAGAREFLRLEREDESRRKDAEDGATVRAGDVSDPANRYRARYRRAKRIAEER